MNDQSKEIYDLLVKAEKRKSKKIRDELLRSIGVAEEFFSEGGIEIDKLTCRGAECKLCIDTCPTNALYWGEGAVKIEGSICIYCGACVLSCIVDNCIIVNRKRKNGESEKLGTPQEVIQLLNRRSTQRRVEALKKVLITSSSQ